MNILFDAWVMDGSFAGIAKSTYYLYSYCHKVCPDFHAYGFNCKREDAYPEAGITLIGKRSKRELYAFAKEHNIEIVHYPTNFISRPILSRLKIVLTIHDLIPYEDKAYFSDPLKKKLYLLLMRYGIHRADLITTVSDYSRRAIMDFAKGRVSPRMIYWDVTLPKTPSHAEPLDYRYFLYAGGYDRRKGIDRLVRAFLNMKREGLTDARLVLTGNPRALDPETDELIRLGAANGSIVQTGYVDDAALCTLYRNAICMLYLSNMEGFGLPVIEAMQYDCPVITTRNTCLPEIGGDAACYVDRDNPGELIETMLKMERDPEFRKRHIEAGRANLQRFSWDRSANAFLDALQSLGSD